MSPPNTKRLIGCDGWDRLTDWGLLYAPSPHLQYWRGQNWAYSENLTQCVLSLDVSFSCVATKSLWKSQLGKDRSMQLPKALSSWVQHFQYETPGKLGSVAGYTCTYTIRYSGSPAGYKTLIPSEIDCNFVVFCNGATNVCRHWKVRTPALEFVLSFL